MRKAEGECSPHLPPILFPWNKGVVEGGAIHHKGNKKWEQKGKCFVVTVDGSKRRKKEKWNVAPPRGDGLADRSCSYWLLPTRLLSLRRRLPLPMRGCLVSSNTQLQAAGFPLSEARQSLLQSRADASWQNLAQASRVLFRSRATMRFFRGRDLKSSGLIHSLCK